MVKVIFLITLFLSTAIALPYPNERSNVTSIPISRSPKPETIPEQYIVVFKPKLTSQQVSDHYDDINNMVSNGEDGLKTRAADSSTYGINSKYKIGSFRGYSGKFSETCIEKIKQRSDVSIY